jgi:hypothetical protein
MSARVSLPCERVHNIERQKLLWERGQSVVDPLFLFGDGVDGVFEKHVPQGLEVYGVFPGALVSPRKQLDNFIYVV